MIKKFGNSILLLSHGSIVAKMALTMAKDSDVGRLNAYIEDKVTRKKDEIGIV